MILDERDYNEEPRPRIKRLEPTNPYEYCRDFARITKHPGGVGYFLKLSKGFSMNTFAEIVSFAKADKDQKLAILKWFADYRKSLKDINSDK